MGSFKRKPYTFQDRSGKYMRGPPPLDELTNSQGQEKGKGGSSLSTHNKGGQGMGLEILVSGDEKGFVTLAAYGQVPIAVVDMSSLFPRTQGVSACRVESVSMGGDAKTVAATLSDGIDFSVATLDSYLLYERKEEVRAVAHQFLQVQELLAHLQKGVTALQQKWEEIVKGALPPVSRIVPSLSPIAPPPVFLPFLPKVGRNRHQATLPFPFFFSSLLFFLSSPSAPCHPLNWSPPRPITATTTINTTAYHRHHYSHRNHHYKACM
jgi:hypothetical protein